MRFRVLCSVFCVLICVSCAVGYVSAADCRYSVDASSVAQLPFFNPVEVPETTIGSDVDEPAVDGGDEADSAVVNTAVYAPLSGGSYFVADSALGNALVYYVPVDYLNKLAYTSNGDLFNLSASTVYLYCPSFPDYTIMASRFSKFQFRPNASGYSYSDCNFKNVDPVTVAILENGDKPIVSTYTLIVGIIALVVLLGCIFIIRR